ncbi:hypothetical protein N9229_02350, partial [Saprospiraceae bacterium]|nr:hypothetical protein [Saprospiraceae bacterium]
TASGSVGIGIAAPQSRFHVKDGLIRVDAKPGVSTIFKGYNSLAVNTYTFKHSNSDGAILELDNGSSTNTIRLRSDGNSYLNGGNVGIGTLSPTEKLQVNGTIKATDINFTGLPVYSNEAAAVATGLPPNGICGSLSGVTGTSLINFSRGELGPSQSCSFYVNVLVPCGIEANTYTNITSQVTAYNSNGDLELLAAATNDLVVNSALSATPLHLFYGL